MSDPERTVLVSETDGPFLTAALFCERVLEEKDGVTSIIRIVDRIVTQATGVDPPERMPPLQAMLTLVVSLKSGFAKGSYSVTIQGTTPTGRSLAPVALPVLLEGDDRGVGLVGVLNLQLEEDGLYWFDVRFERRLLSRIPLRVVYQRVQFGGAPGSV